MPTVTLSSARDITALVSPPRSAFLNFPIGHQAGKPFDRQGQQQIVGDALRLLETASEGGTIVDLPYDWGGDWEATARTSGVGA